MSLENALRGINFVFDNAVRKGASAVEVGYHGGGEPTVNWPVLTASYAHARKRAAEAHLDLQASLATNGMVDDRQIDWIVQNLTGVSLSCDGLPAVHDRCRVTACGGGSSSRVAHTMRRFDQAAFNYGVRLTVTAEHIPALPDSVEYVCAEFKPKSIQIEPVYALGRGAEAAFSESDQFIEAYLAASRRAAGYGREISFSAARVGTLTNHFCSVSRDNFCLSADGNVTACYEAFSEDGPWAHVFFYGRPVPDSAGFLFDEGVLDHLRGQTAVNRAHCRSCFAKWSCGGDCYYKWLATTGGGEFNGSPRCHIIRELTKEQILERIEGAGGLFWHESGCGNGAAAKENGC
jgi:uncharacterized protein